MNLVNQLYFFKRNCKIYHVNKTQIQHEESILCGLFCIVFIYFTVRGKNIFSSFYTTNLKKNDTIVKSLVKKLSKEKKNVNKNFIILKEIFHLYAYYYYY